MAYRVCAIDGFVAWDGNRYAVPYESIYDVLPVRVTERELFVYAPDLKLLARHELAPRSAGVEVGSQRLHRVPERRTLDLDTLRASFEDLGDGAANFFAALSAPGRPPRGAPGAAGAAAARALRQRRQSPRRCATR